MVSPTENAPPTSSDRDQCLTDFNAINHQINTALHNDDCDAVLVLINQRAPIVNSLVEIHQNLPFPKEITDLITAQERDLQEKVAALKISVGDELRKVVHSIQSVNKYKKVSNETYPQ
jgi:hypothetical protein